VSARARSFGSAVEAYVRGRPGYPEEAVRFVLPRVPCSVVDVGAGTGKLTEVLVRLGCGVVAVEPDDEMRARIQGGDARAGVAEALPLADCSVDAVVAGQASHWFEMTQFLTKRGACFDLAALSDCSGTHRTTASSGLPSLPS
jgi:SAM-dependent methyltransferase